MYEQVEKSKESRNSMVANSVDQKKSDVKQCFGFVDNRSEAIFQMKEWGEYGTSLQLKKSKKQKEAEKEAQAEKNRAKKAEDAETYGRARLSKPKDIRKFDLEELLEAKAEFEVDAKMDHIINRHMSGKGISGKTEFPKSWNRDKIAKAITIVCMNAKKVTIDPKYGPFLQGMFDGITIEVYFDKTADDIDESLEVSTAYPLPNQPGVVRNP